MGAIQVPLVQGPPATPTFEPSDSRLRWGRKAKGGLLQEAFTRGMKDCSYKTLNLVLVIRLVEDDAIRFYETLLDKDIKTICSNFELNVLQFGRGDDAKFDRKATIQLIAQHHASSTRLASLPPAVSGLQQMATENNIRFYRDTTKWHLVNLLIEHHTKDEPGFRDPWRGTSLCTSQVHENSHQNRGVLEIDSHNNPGCVSPGSSIYDVTQNSSEDGRHCLRLSSGGATLLGSSTKSLYNASPLFPESASSTCRPIGITMEPSARNEPVVYQQSPKYSHKEPVNQDQESTPENIAQYKQMLQLYCMLIYGISRGYVSETHPGSTKWMYELFCNFCKRIGASISEAPPWNISESAVPAEIPSLSFPGEVLSETCANLGVVLEEYIHCVETTVKEHRLEQRKHLWNFAYIHRQMYRLGVLTSFSLGEEYYRLTGTPIELSPNWELDPYQPTSPSYERSPPCKPTDHSSGDNYDDSKLAAVTSQSMEHELIASVSAVLEDGVPSTSEEETTGTADIAKDYYNNYSKPPPMRSDIYGEEGEEGEEEGEGEEEWEEEGEEEESDSPRRDSVESGQSGRSEF